MNFVAKLLLFASAILSCSTATAGQLVLNSGVEQVTLLELYTSQGCSSCPPAERWLNAYVDSDALWEKTVPMVFHVDYWDYLGWKDTLADSTHAERVTAIDRSILVNVYLLRYPGRRAQEMLC